MMSPKPVSYTHFRTRFNTRLAPLHEITMKSLAMLVGATLIVALVSPAYGRGAPESFAPLVEKLAPSVVNISTTMTVSDSDGPRDFQLPPGSPLEEFFRRFGEEFEERRGDQDRRPQRGRQSSSVGSGFIISQDGLIVTNNHVVEGGEKIQVRLEDQSTYSAEVIGLDPKTDLALLKIDAGRDLPAVEFGDSDVMRVGDWVVAIGSPFGLGGTVTAGIISARSRNINQGPYDDFFQTDAAINRGNSGGPMFNLEGQVIGVNTAIFSPSGGSVGIGFAISSNLVRNVISQLQEYGETRRGWIGVQIQTVTPEIAGSIGLDEPRGALVSNVNKDGPAKAAGVQDGDIIIRFDGQNVETMRELPRIVARTKIGAEVDMTVWRDGKEIDIQIVLGHLEDAEQKGLLRRRAENGEQDGSDGTDVLEMSLSTLTDAVRSEYDLPDDLEGVLITHIASGSPAADRGLRAGDVIVEAGRQAVSSPKEVEAAVLKAQDSGRTGLLLRVYTRGDIRFFAVPLNEER